MTYPKEGILDLKELLWEKRQPGPVTAVYKWDNLEQEVNLKEDKNKNKTKKKVHKKYSAQNPLNPV